MRKFFYALVIAALPLLMFVGGCALSVDHGHEVAVYRAYDGYRYERFPHPYGYGHYEAHEYPDGHHEHVYVRDY